MSVYYNCGGGGCFAGKCLVKMANNIIKRVDQIKKGDNILNKDGSLSKVNIVVKIQSSSSMIELVELEGGLLLTPKHPVKINETWIKPCNIK